MCTAHLYSVFPSSVSEHLEPAEDFRQSLVLGIVPFLPECNGAGPSGNNSTIHTAKTGGSGIGTGYTFPSGEAADSAFHTYGIVWTQNEMQFFVDNASTPF